MRNHHHCVGLLSSQWWYVVNHYDEETIKVNDIHLVISLQYYIVLMVFCHQHDNEHAHSTDGLYTMQQSFTAYRP